MQPPEFSLAVWLNRLVGFTASLTRRFPPLMNRRLHNKKNSGVFDMYLRANKDFPVTTALTTSAVLWIAGDTVAQTIELRGKQEPLDFRRLFATTFEGSLVNGGIACVWYKVLDDFATKRLCLVPGSLRFVFAKLGLEFAFWHPISLFTFWLVVGTLEGHSLQRIRNELRRDFLPTLLGEYVLWTPIDLFNFWKVPVSLQVLVCNCGCFVEAVFLSYVHACGFPSLPPASLAPAHSSTLNAPTAINNALNSHNGVVLWVGEKAPES